MWRKGERRNTNKQSIQISDNQPAYIRQVPFAMLGLQQMFEVTAARFHAVTPLIDSVIDDTLLQTGPLGNQTLLQIVPIKSKRKKVKIILCRDRDISKDLSCK